MHLRTRKEMSDVPAHWDQMDACGVSRHFSIMPNEMPWRNEALDLHAVDEHGTALDGKTYSCPDRQFLLPTGKAGIAYHTDGLWC